MLSKLEKLDSQPVELEKLDLQPVAASGAYARHDILRNKVMEIISQDFPESKHLSDEVVKKIQNGWLPNEIQSFLENRQELHNVIAEILSRESSNGPFALDPKNHSTAEFDG